jgi:hypothetical protein
MFSRLRLLLSPNAPCWRIHGYDAYSGDPYPLPGRFPSEAAALRAARRALRKIERMQPAATTGGQADGGMQDHVYVVRPDGSLYRVFPQG